MFANLKVATRLSLGFGVVIVLLIAISLLSVLRLGTVSDSATTIMEDRYPKVQMAEGIVRNALTNGRLLRSVLLATSDSEVESLKQQVSETRAKNAELVKRLDGVALAYAPFRPAEQERYTRSLRFPRWVAAGVLFNFDAHELHHGHAHERPGPVRGRRADACAHGWIARRGSGPDPVRRSEGRSRSRKRYARRQFESVAVDVRQCRTGCRRRRWRCRQC